MNVHPSLSSPSFSSYCDDDDDDGDPLSTYVLFALGFLFCYRALKKFMVKGKKFNSFAFKSTVVQCCFPVRKTSGFLFVSMLSALVFPLYMAVGVKIVI